MLVRPLTDDRRDASRAALVPFRRLGLSEGARAIDRRGERSGRKSVDSMPSVGDRIRTFAPIY